MTHEAHSDHGTVLRRDQFAIAANMDGSFDLYIPDLPDDTELPLNVQLLAAIAVKIDDDEWIADMLSGLAERRRTIS
jgi:hypothetical protein